MPSSVAGAAAKDRVARPAADRFVAFAFAAGELLVETDLNGLIGFATGAFRSRFGTEAARFIGRNLTELFRPADHTALAFALAMAPGRGRIAPVLLHLADAGATASSVAALLMPEDAGRPARLSFSIGPAPVSSSFLSGTEAGLEDRHSFARSAEAALRDGREAGLGLLEVRFPNAGRTGLSEDMRHQIEASIGQVLADGPPGRTAGALADGRYGVLSATALDIGALAARLEAVLRASPVGQQASVAGSGISLESGGASTAQATRALRYVLARFAESGKDAADALTEGGGLAGIIALAGQRAHALRDIIAHRRFRLVYQPIVHLGNRGVHHYEALLRPIATPDSKVQGTQDFVTFAEAVGLSEELDWAVLETALAALQATKGVSVAVNMSGLSMQNPDYCARLLARLGGGAGLAGRLLIELTETAEITDMAAAASSIEQLRAAGVPVCLDDFGSGASSFHYLRAFGVDYVKIDGVYVRRAGTSPRDRGFVASMIELACSAGAQVVAEMIETEAQAALMRELGVQYGQGWLFGRPGLLPGSRARPG